MADCGGLMIGVDIIEPYTPPLEMVKVPPAMSSIEMVPSRAFLPSAARDFSIPAKLRPSAPRSTGTTSPLGVATAMEMST
eukprot:366294-Chlamydomonas_euryale.AAC.6